MLKKAVITLIVFVTLLALYAGYRIIKNSVNSDSLGDGTEKVDSEKADSVKVDSVKQYRLAYNDVKGNMTQTIALNKGTAVFEVDHKGVGKYLFLLKTTSGDSLFEIAKGEGGFSTKRTFYVPETTAYLLEVLTSGTWSFRYR